LGVPEGETQIRCANLLLLDGEKNGGEDTPE